MDFSVFAIDMPGWLSWTSGALYVADICLAVLVIVLVGCMVGQVVTGGGQTKAPKRSTHLAH